MKNIAIVAAILILISTASAVLPELGQTFGVDLTGFIDAQDTDCQARITDTTTGATLESHDIRLDCRNLPLEDIANNCLIQPVGNRTFFTAIATPGLYTCPTNYTVTIQCSINTNSTNFILNCPEFQNVEFDSTVELHEEIRLTATTFESKTDEKIFCQGYLFDTDNLAKVRDIGLIPILEEIRVDDLNVRLRTFSAGLETFGNYSINGTCSNGVIFEHSFQVRPNDPTREVIATAQTIAGSMRGISGIIILFVFLIPVFTVFILVIGMLLFGFGTTFNILFGWTRQ